MKKNTKLQSSRLQPLADWIKGASIMAFLAAGIACVADLFVVSKGVMTVPFWGYIAVIGSGVALQVLGSAIPNMRFGSKPKSVESVPQKPVEPYVINE